MPSVFCPINLGLSFDVSLFRNNSYAIQNMHSQPDSESGEKRELDLVESENEQIDQDLDRIATVNINNYHGLSAKIILVYTVCSPIILQRALC
jgi:hypothetical protein